MDVPGSGLREVQSTNSLHLYEGVGSLQRTSGHMQELGHRRFGVMYKTGPLYESLVAQRAKPQKGRNRL